MNKKNTPKVQRKLLNNYQKIWETIDKDYVKRLQGKLAAWTQNVK